MLTFVANANKNRSDEDEGESEERLIRDILIIEVQNYMTEFIQLSVIEVLLNPIWAYWASNSPHAARLGIHFFHNTQWEMHLLEGPD